MKFFSDNPKKGDSFDGIIGRTPVMQNVFKLIEQVARTNVTVMISGESGTGKELVAFSIHKRSTRSKKPFIAVNMGAISPELVISELFGHEKGAYTGAIERKAGRFERANTGTLFMDEISTMDHRTQISLLRVLETRRVHPIGARNSIPINVRVIGATNKELLDMVHSGGFREDLYYRFNVFSIQLPSLRERIDDIPLIANEYILHFAKRYKKKIKILDDDIVRKLCQYDWPGNVRELKNVIHRSVVLCEEDHLNVLHFPPRVIQQPDEGIEPFHKIRVGSTLEEAECEIIRNTLARTSHNKQKTAHILGISRKSLYNKIQKYNLNGV
ncbi:sigma-54-dependent Fis family transcriptional regulator [candidate division KSB1 bacterium]|nr:sigma-54-dependent Fis family transcriptional regulator [candidate division KSB1 bacterium]